MFASLPSNPLEHVVVNDATLGEVCLSSHARLGSRGFDLFIPNGGIRTAAERLMTLAKEVGGRAAGWNAFEIARIEAGIPRYGADMDETNLPPETGTEERSISYTKGCYSGQEVIARIRTYGQVAKALRGLTLPSDLRELPSRGPNLLEREGVRLPAERRSFSHPPNEHRARLRSARMQWARNRTGRRRPGRRSSRDDRPPALCRDPTGVIPGATSVLGYRTRESGR